MAKRYDQYGNLIPEEETAPKAPDANLNKKAPKPNAQGGVSNQIKRAKTTTVEEPIYVGGVKLKTQTKKTKVEFSSGDLIDLEADDRHKRSLSNS